MGKKVSEIEIVNKMKQVIKFDKNINDVLTNFNLKDVTTGGNKNIVFPIVLRTGGIGDLIALSSICH
ncbi:MAG: hypothetical protein RLY43_1091 [Bacteroidota bacterium]